MNLGVDEVPSRFGGIGAEIGAKVAAALFHRSVRNALIAHPQNLEQACRPPEARVDQVVRVVIFGDGVADEGRPGKWLDD